MSWVRDGYPAVEGIVTGPVHLLEWGVPEVPHETIPLERTEEEVERFHEAREWAKERVRQIRQVTAERLGTMEGRIFEPQLLMLDDEEVVEGTVRYIRENRLSAARAFDFRMLELQALWIRTRNPMVLDRLNDVEDLKGRVLHRLLDRPEPGDFESLEHPVLIVAQNLTPSLTVQMDPDRILGIATDLGTRTSHWAILARSLSIPAVVGLLDVSRAAKEGQEAILDGRIGRVILDPDERDREIYRQRKARLQEWEKELAVISKLDAVTEDGHPVSLRANVDLPSEVEKARQHGAEGIGLFRTEFLVVGRSSMPEEEEQYRAYRQAAEAFPDGAVVIRTYDLGGDKFPMFLKMAGEENPFLGWRAIRVCLDRLDLFRPQLRAFLRATVHGDLRMMLPLVNDVEEVLRVRELLGEEEEGLKRDGIPFYSGYKVGILLETPAAALDAAELARHCDFFSIGTNDLVQYTLAVDRTNARLSHLYNPFHPSVVRQLYQISRVARAAGIEVSVCGEMAANPLGAFLLLGLDIPSISVAWPALQEVRKVIRQFRSDEARAAARKALAAPTSRAVIDSLVEGIGPQVDLSAFSGRWSLSLG